jgi:REP element-mobilizing transposase RayT
MQKTMRRNSYFTNNHIKRKEHGGAYSIRRRKSKRPISSRNAYHVTLRSDVATGKRYLRRHKNLINKIIGKAKRRFCVRVYEQAICGNHIHLLVRGRSQVGLQNFFRVVAGHIAQKILEQFPLLASEQKKRGNALEYQRKFWGALIYSRRVRWGRDFKNVMNYIEMNTLEAIGWIPYQKRKTRFVWNGIRHREIVNGAMPP